MNLLGESACCFPAAQGNEISPNETLSLRAHLHDTPNSTYSRPTYSHGHVHPTLTRGASPCLRGAVAGGAESPVSLLCWQLPARSPAAPQAPDGLFPCSAPRSPSGAGTSLLGLLALPQPTPRQEPGSLVHFTAHKAARLPQGPLGLLTPAPSWKQCPATQLCRGAGLEGRDLLVNFTAPAMNLRRQLM